MTFFSNSFSKINEKEIQHLIIDLRDNGGGNPRLATEFLRYLIPTTFVPIAYSQSESQEVTTVSKVRNPQNFRISKSALKCDEGKLIIRNRGLYKKHTPRGNIFSGKIYFLMNAKCASATTIFLALAHYYKLGLFIGEDPGGNYEYVCGHQLAHFTLPHSDLTVQIPLQKSKINTTNQQNKYGVRPNYYVPDHLEDILTYQDTQIKFVLNLISSRKD
jgi:C-terminal processing protease CtpA/Prc